MNWAKFLLKPLGLKYNKIGELFLIVLFAVITTLSAYGQNGYRDADTGSCNFSHDPHISVFNAVLHLIIEMLIFAIVLNFQKQVSELLTGAGQVTKEKERSVAKYMLGLEVTMFFFGLWTVVLSIFNESVISMFQLTVGYNIRKV